jgi:hypothetical protein
MRSTDASQLVYWGLCVAFLLFYFSCAGAGIQQPVGEISYSADKDGEIWFRHSRMQLRFDNEMYCRVFLKKDRQLLSINDIPPDPAKAKPPHYLEIEGTELKDFQLDSRNIGVSEMKTPFGTGKVLQMTGLAKTPSGIEIQKDLTIEFYQEYPEIALLVATYRNLEPTRPIQITRVVNNFFRLDSTRTQSRKPPFAFTAVLGQPDSNGTNIFQITRANFGRTFEISSDNLNEFRSVPILDVWNSEMGMATGDVLTQPRTLLLSVRVAPDQKLEISTQSTIAQELRPGEALVMPKNFWMVHDGGMSKAFEKYSALLASAK